MGTWETTIPRRPTAWALANPSDNGMTGVFERYPGRRLDAIGLDWVDPMTRGPRPHLVVEARDGAVLDWVHRAPPVLGPLRPGEQLLRESYGGEFRLSVAGGRQGYRYTWVQAYSQSVPVVQWADGRTSREDSSMVDTRDDGYTWRGLGWHLDTARDSAEYANGGLSMRARDGGLIIYDRPTATTSISAWMDQNPHASEVLHHLVFESYVLEVPEPRREPLYRCPAVACVGWGFTESVRREGTTTAPIVAARTNTLRFLLGRTTPPPGFYRAIASEFGGR